jgi:hypothetical protein
MSAHWCSQPVLRRRQRRQCGVTLSGPMTPDDGNTSSMYTLSHVRDNTTAKSITSTSTTRRFVGETSAKSFASFAVDASATGDLSAKTHLLLSTVPRPRRRSSRSPFSFSCVLTASIHLVHWPSIHHGNRAALFDFQGLDSLTRKTGWEVSSIIEALRECYPLTAVDNFVSIYDKWSALYKSMRKQELLKASHFGLDWLVGRAFSSTRSRDFRSHHESQQVVWRRPTVPIRPSQGTRERCGLHSWRQRRWSWNRKKNTQMWTGYSGIRGSYSTSAWALLASCVSRATVMSVCCFEIHSSIVSERAISCKDPRCLLAAELHRVKLTQLECLL